MQNINQIVLIRFLTYFPAFLVYDTFNIQAINRWAPLFKNYFYIQFPDFLYHLPALEVLKVAFLTSALFCAFSLGNKIMSIVSFLTGFLLFGLYYSVGVQEHHHYLLPHLLLIFCLYENVESFKDEEFIFLGKLLVMSVFFHAGLSKFIKVGFDWIKHDLVLDYFLFARVAFSPYAYSVDSDLINLFFIRNYDYLKFFLYLVPLMELMAPLALFKRFNYFFLYFLFLQIGIYFVMRISFIEFSSAYGFFIVPFVLDLLTKYGKYEPLRKLSSEISGRYIRK